MKFHYQAAVEAALEHSKIRKQFSEPIINNQSVQFRLAGIVPNYLIHNHVMSHRNVHKLTSLSIDGSTCSSFIG